MRMRSMAAGRGGYFRWPLHSRYDFQSACPGMRSWSWPDITAPRRE
jgi:hypothetical protein